MWEEIADMPGEIFDLTDIDREEMSKVFDKDEEEYNVYWNTDREEFEVVAWNQLLSCTFFLHLLPFLVTMLF